MLEIPESITLADQLNQAVEGKTILNVTANHSPHKLVWYFGDPSLYHDRLSGKVFGHAYAQGGNVEVHAGEMRILFQDGACPRFLAPGTPPPKRHQLLIEFDDAALLTVTVRMYGGICIYREGENDNRYYLAARDRRSPLSESFDFSYFRELCGCEGFEKMSAKAFLATGQRIPGLGNGVLQDILWKAGIHPKRRMGTLSQPQLEGMYRAVRETLAGMALLGGRNTERDLFGCPGGYRGILNKDTAGKPCPACGETIGKGTFLGGSIYFCPQCQPLEKE